MPEENEYYLSSTEITSQNFILKKCLSDEQKLRAFAASTHALQEIFKKVHQIEELRYQMNIWIYKEMSARNVKKRVNIKYYFLNYNYF